MINNLFNKKQEKMNNKNIIGKVFAGIIALIILAAVMDSYFTIQPGYVGLIKTFGKLNNETYEQGLHFKKPFISNVVKMDIRKKKIEGTSNAGTNDVQSVNATVAVNYSLVKKEVPKLYETYGKESEIEDVEIKPAIEEAIKSAISKYNASELITKRDEVSKGIYDNLKAKLENKGIKVNEINVTNLEFSPEFDRAIEAKVKAEQEALKAKADLDKVKYQAQQSIERAKAEAEKIKIQAEAVRKQGGAEYVKLQWIQRWNGKLPDTMLSSDNNMMINLK